MKIYEAKEIQRKNLSWLVYGKSGVGKTALVGTFPPPICCTNFPNEDGITTLAGHSGVTVFDVEAATTDMDSTPGSGGFADWVIKQQIERVAAGGMPFRTVAIDSVKSWIELLTKEHVYGYGTVKGHGRIKIPTDLYLYDEWGTKIKATIDRLRTVGVELVLVSTAAINKDELTGVQVGGPDMFKSLERRLPAMVAATIYLDADSVTMDGENGKTTTFVNRVAHLAPWNGMTARVRGCVIKGDGCVPNPSYSKIMAAMGEPLFD